MSRLLIKLEFFFYFLKSKALKKRIFKIEKKNSLNFKKIISKYRFENFWFLNNIEIINYFLPKSKDIKFDYMEIGSHEGMSLLNILEQYKNVSATAIDLWSDNKIQKVFDSVKVIEFTTGTPFIGYERYKLFIKSVGVSTRFSDTSLAR